MFVKAVERERKKRPVDWCGLARPLELNRVEQPVEFVDFCAASGCRNHWEEEAKRAAAKGGKDIFADDRRGASDFRRRCYLDLDLVIVNAKSREGAPAARCAYVASLDANVVIRRRCGALVSARLFHFFWQK